MADTLALAVLFAVALSCSAFVLLLDALRPIIVAYLKALWARLKAGDDPFGDGADGDWPFVPSDLKSVFHDNGGK